MADIAHGSWIMLLLGSLSKGAFERPMSTRSDFFSLLKCLYASKFVLLNVLALIETICPKIWIKTTPENAKFQPLVNMRR